MHTQDWLKANLMDCWSKEMWSYQNAKLREVFICACKKFRSLIKAIVEASGDFTK
jgi:hypothetical protein